MEWYAPLTMLPAIGLIILSTSNFIISLNSEIYLLEKEMDSNLVIIKQKMKQLKRLGLANVLLYTSALFFMFSALAKVFYPNESLFKALMIIAAISTTLALGFLFIHSAKSIQIRQKHLKL